MRNIIDLDKVFNQFRTEYQEREFQLLNQSFFLHLNDVQSGGTQRSMVSKEAHDNKRLDTYLSRSNRKTYEQQAMDDNFTQAVLELTHLWDCKRNKSLFATGAYGLEGALTAIIRGIHPHFHTPPKQFLSVYSEPYQLKEKLRGTLELEHYSADEAVDVITKIMDVFTSTNYPTHTLNLNIFVVAATKPTLRAMFVVLEDLLITAARNLRMVPGSITCHVQKVASSYLDIIEFDKDPTLAAEEVNEMARELR